MKKFLIGLAVGAVAVYAASKLIDEETKEKLYDDFDKLTDEAKYKMRVGKIKAKRAGMKAKRELLDRKSRFDRATGEFVERVSDEVHDLDDKLREKLR